MSNEHKTDEDKDNGAGKMSRKKYEKELQRLQAELYALQAWVKAKGLRIIFVFEDNRPHQKDDSSKSNQQRVHRSRV
jgi:polyphosphate kinase 2 (PPK2 family)